jgi:hypothetical protein
MFAYRINVTINVSTTRIASHRHFFDIDCQPHRYSDKQAMQVAKELRERFPLPQYNVTLSRQEMACFEAVVIDA